MRHIAAGAMLALSVPALGQGVSGPDRLLHEELLVLDTHLDTPALFERPGWKFADWHDYGQDFSQVDLPRMQQGGLDGGFFVIYTPQGPLTAEGYAKARDDALLRAAAIQRLVAADDRLAFATTADDAERLHRAGKRIVFQLVENSYPLGEDLSLLATFHRLGVRMAGPVHSKNNQLADSTTDTPRWNGLSPLGQRWVAEMNRLGMIVDASHASNATFDQLLALSKAPIILSHSGPRALFDHPRNLDDARMRALAKAGGVMQINSIFLAPDANVQDDAERDAIVERQERWATLSPEERRTLMADKAALDAKRPYTTATFDHYMRAMLHAIAVMGVDHVGIGADWDGNGGVQGMEDVSALPRITARLRAEGFSREDIAKIMGGNVLRLLRQAEAYTARAR